MESLRNRRGDICIIQAIIAIYVEVLIFLSISLIFAKPLLAKNPFIYIYIFKCMCFKNNYDQNWFFFSPNWYLFLVEASVLGSENLKYSKMRLESGQKSCAFGCNRQ